MADPQDNPIVPQARPGEALQQIVSAVSRHRARVVFATLVFVLLGLGLSMIWPSKYESSTLFVLRDWHLVADSQLLGELTDLPLQKKLKTLEGELKSRKRIDAVMSELQWVEWLETAGKESERRDLSLKLAENLTVTMDADVTGAHNIGLLFRWTSPRKAADFINRLRDNWIQLTLQTYQKGLEESKERAEAVVDDREKAYHEALNTLQKFERENDVPTLLTEEVNHTLKGELLASITSKKGELDAAVQQVRKLEAELEQVPREIDAMLAPPNPEVAAIMQKAALAEAAATMARELYTEKNPKRIKAETTLAEATAALKAAGGPVGAKTSKVTNPAYYAKAELLDEAKAVESIARASVDAYEDELQNVQERLDKLPMVKHEQARLQHSVELADQLLNEGQVQLAPLREKVKRVRATSLLNASGDPDSLVSSGPFEILEIGIEPEDPVLPVGAIILAVALVVGLAAGALGPVLTEMTRSSFGTAKDVSRTLGVPVLGAVDLILTARDLRARTVQKSLTLATMSLVLATLGLALYLYAYHPEKLPFSLVRYLRDVTMALT